MGQESSQIRHEIEDTRAEMGDTVDALAYKTDVKTRVKESMGDKRRRLIELARRSKGRPSKLSARERRELGDLLEKFNYARLGGSVAATLLPFRPLGRLVEFGLGRPAARARRRGAAKT